MIRELAGHDPARYPEILDWPLAEALASYQEALRRDAAKLFMHEQTLYAAGALEKAPKLPKLLEGRGSDS